MFRSFFEKVYNSKNISDAYDTKPDILVYAGLRAEKFVANKFPEKDFENILEAIENIKKINPKFIVLISTIDVYNSPVNVSEETLIDFENLEPYGKNRLYLEKWVEENIDNHLIIRLPGLFGENMKKNFIFDLINFIPSLLNEKLYTEFSLKEEIIKKYYQLNSDGFYKCKNINDEERKELAEIFKKLNFSALNFTDSRGLFQFYNLKYLWKHIEIAMNNNIKKLNLATEPVSISEIYEYINKKEFINKTSSKPPNYNFKTIHDKVFNGNNGYIFTKGEMLKEIKKFVGDNK